MNDRTTICNAMTIDLEDWAQSTLGPDTPITTRVVRNTDRLLDLLEQHRVRATFFALGKVCETFPALLPSIAAAGHEIACHGYGHRRVDRMTPDEFRKDVARSIDIIETQTGRRPIGYRAPQFSITASTRWAGPILCDLGIRYSSSVFPIAHRRYGIADAPRFVHRWDSGDLVEFPLSTVRRFGRNLPVAGGGYLRLLPASITSAAIRETNRQGHPAVVYLHPYELDVNELAELKRDGWSIRWSTYVNQSLFRGRIRGRLTSLLRRFRFAPMADVLGMNRNSACDPSLVTRRVRTLRVLNGRPTSSEVGDTNSSGRFESPTAKPMDHPTNLERV